jgi:hypothetical protein
MQHSVLISFSSASMRSFMMIASDRKAHSSPHGNSLGSGMVKPISFLRYFKSPSRGFISPDYFAPVDDNKNATTGAELKKRVTSRRRLTTLVILGIFRCTSGSTCHIPADGREERYRLKKFAPFRRFGLLRRGVAVRGNRRQGLLCQVLAFRHLGQSHGTFCTIKRKTLRCFTL